ncbi:hypothetical protein [Marinactinospora rubrisoli]|uniref:Uncharacterized protein n=1 Tax=Marinactinospora rubrisoli TaxID=2715399 RepID=A0ABW2KNB3_9ACTN
MSNEAEAYVRRLDVRHSPIRKFVLQTLACRVEDDTKSWTIKTATMAADCLMDTSQLRRYYSDLLADGFISILDRTDEKGRQKSSRIFVHGPWDLWGGTNRPFAEVQRPANSKRLDVTRPVDASPEVLGELQRRFLAFAAEDGDFPDGTPRSTFRLGSRAHSIVCWYGLGRTVVHDGREAVVTAITDRDGRRRGAVRVQLSYTDDESASDGWIEVLSLTPPKEDVEETPSSEGVANTRPSPGGREANTRPHGEANTRPHGEANTRPPSSPPSATASASSSAAPSPDAPPAAREEDEGFAENKPEGGLTAAAAAPGGSGVAETPAAIIMRATDATTEEAQALVNLLRPEARKTLAGLIATMAANRDLEHRLWLLRRQRGSQARTETPGRGAVTCDLHRERTVPCPLCMREARDPSMREELLRTLRVQGAEARPDLAALLTTA